MSEPVEIWEIGFEDAAAVDWQVLDRRETAAADAFIHADDRYRYGLIHTALRLRLSELLDIVPGAVPITVGPHGRPFVADRSAEIDFNLSHSRRTGLIAISRAGAVGVDVEDRDDTADYSDMIDTIFEPHEAACLHRLERSVRNDLFLRGWTRKEAVAKAVGTGFLLDPKLFRVPLDDCGSWSVSVRSAVTPRLALIDLSSDARAAAVAGAGLQSRPRVRRFRFERPIRARSGTTRSF
ncbi:lipopeptide antibiotics iturin a biosynthesis protein [Rhodopseudomonas palustris]|uniref:Lipopeptide antibiotics iturin a biosynthesis protein n=1 Tax=Rhodopseudomonas palustris TaxID=1076 RepID=A0A323UYD4_RHOPL|nr:4'-phosphopantetheinyl transferase superfamily protein [Rhodopseudomonas palustris]PZA12808.1 lipopeptide antibiotics iturin a biosynthesis protein [Rhodopseudomonas palustris]